MMSHILQKEHFTHRINLFPLLLLAMVFLKCDLHVVTTEPQSNPYRTQHFIIYYNSSFFTPVQIEYIGLERERLLAHVNSYLCCSYNRTIEIFIYDTLKDASANASVKERINENYDYSLTDEGHEIAHLVSMQEWGYTRFNFLLEGVAEASCDYNNKSIINIYHGYILQLQEMGLTDFNKEMDSLTVRLTTGKWNKTSLEYDQAGAFIHFLKCTFGINKIKEWYQLSMRSQESDSAMATTFLKVFGIDYLQGIERFKTELLNSQVH